ncbi:hypothetical protein [Streptomyces cyslabdanicus]|uniref:hypothetical protein n=1 Tax=Streptomyces cyslabdanicus TaxID=1470456 RepID=UPI00404438F1
MIGLPFALSVAVRVKARSGRVAVDAPAETVGVDPVPPAAPWSAPVVMFMLTRIHDDAGALHSASAGSSPARTVIVREVTALVSG